MKSFKTAWDYRVPITIGIVASVVIVMFLNGISVLYRDGVCSLDDKNGTACLREWLSATSGWAAFLAAVVTTIILIRQLTEQQRQTAFILGDEIPSLDTIQDVKDAEKLVLRIVNWNRRSFKPERIDIPDMGLAIAMHSIDINGAPVYKSVFYIDGWVDRSKSPKICTFTLKVANKTPENTWKYLQDFPKSTEIVITGILLGEKHKRTQIRCFLHP